MTLYAADNSKFVESGQELLNWMAWGSLVAAVLALITCGILMIFGRRHHNYYAQNGFVGIAWVTLGLVVVAASTGIVNATGGWVDNSWSNDSGGLPGWQWIVDHFPITSDPPASTPPPTTPPPDTPDPRLSWIDSDLGSGGHQVTVLFPADPEAAR